jgi:hypothetical protein
MSSLFCPIDKVILTSPGEKTPGTTDRKVEGCYLDANLRPSYNIYDTNKPGGEIS